MSDLVLTERLESGRLAVLRMNRPDQRNATSIAMLDAIDAALDGLFDAAGDGHSAPEALVIAGTGKSFCAGLDLDEIRGDADTIRTLLLRLGEVMRRIRRLPAFTVAAVQGAAIGGGFGFMVAADVSVTHPEVKVGYPPVATGLSPALMAPWLFRRIGPSQARSMMLSGGTIGGHTAFARGLTTEVVDASDVEAAAMKRARGALEAPAGALTTLKSFLNELDESAGHDDVLERAALVSAEVMSSDATQAALARLLG
ncbi:MAG: enoyl-CoA hydratase/isomerase family protein [Phycisphaerales bacterium]